MGQETQESRPLRVLLVEDSEDDAFLELRELQRAGYHIEWERVETAEALVKALENRQWDVVLCDYVLPELDAPAAVELIRARGFDIPIVIVSGQVGEEFAVAALKSGADDYVMKDNLRRLAPAVARELRQAEERRAGRRAEAALRATEARLQDLVHDLDAIIWEAEAEGPRFLFVSRQAEKILGYPAEAWIRTPSFWAQLVHPEDRGRATRAHLGALRAGARPYELEFRMIAADGREIWMRCRARFVEGREGRRVRGIFTDVTARKRAELEDAVLLEVAREVAGNLDVRDLTARVHRLAARASACERVGTYLWDETRQTFTLQALYGVPHHLMAVTPAWSAEVPLTAAIREGCPVVINDPEHKPWVPPNVFARFGISRLAIVPLVARADVIGALAAAREKPGKGFDASDLNLLTRIAGQVALSVTAARAFRAQEEEARVSRALARAGQALISSLDQGRILDHLCRLTTEVLECDCSHTFLLDPEGASLFPAAGFGDTPEQWEAMRVLRIPCSAVRPTLQRLESGGIVQVAADEVGDLVPAGLLESYGITRGMYVALQRGDQLVGVQTAGFRGRRAPFAPWQERIALGVGQLGSLALANARLMLELERASRIKSDFVATMSHELRTPLNAILGYNDLLIEGAYGPPNAEQKGALERIRHSAGELLELINATLDVTRLEAGSLPVHWRTVVLPGLLREVQASAAASSKDSVRLVLDIAGSLPAVESDPLKLKVILKNLVGNAMKFTDTGTVTVRAVTAAGGVEFSVSDTGPGIAPEVLPVIFEPFRQGDSSATRRHGGVGLGLYIARQLVTLLGGTIAVESKLGHGSTFRVWLPQRRP